MTDVAIRANGLSKRYRISQGARASYDTLRESLVRAVQWPYNTLRKLTRSSSFNPEYSGSGRDQIWALKDVTFEIPHGEVIGIIGRNGAGKSTLLKVISRITDPTEGRVELYGRVGSLLEVGTGFHPELTGRENLYLNGAILGMRKNEINKKLDEIVAFSQLEKFLDTPVKFYSSGMYVRLAFAVAAHLEPEILLVDEVLAVGDAEFQKKCLGKLGDVARSGRTVLFVSHNMGAMQTLCSTVFLMESGRLLETGPPAKVIGDYLKGSSVEAARNFNFSVRDERFVLKEIKIEQNGYEDAALFDPQDDVLVKIHYQICQPLAGVLLGFDVHSGDGVHIFRTYDSDHFGMGPREPGDYVSTLCLPGGLFQFGTYYLDMIVGIHRVRDWITRNDIRLKLTFEGARVTDVDFPGLIQPPAKWRVQKMQLQETAE